MYQSIEDFVKQSWTYITATLKYLKEVSGVAVYTEQRKDLYKQIANLLLGLGALESVSIKNGAYYKVCKYEDEWFTGRFLGLSKTDETLVFEVLYAPAAEKNYRKMENLFHMELTTDLTNNRINFTPVTIDKDDLPLHINDGFKGVLLEQLMKEKA